MSSLSEEHLDALETAWKKYIDSNDKGIIDFDEWNDSIQKLHCGLSQQDIKNVFKSIDQQNSGHIDQSDFIKTILNDTCINDQLSKILKLLLPTKQQDLNNDINDKDDEKEEQKKENDINKWRKIYNKHFNEMNNVNQEQWIQTMLSLKIESVDSDDLRLFHACLDSQFRSCFDFDEFYDTFTCQSLHHQEMDKLRDKLKYALLPKETREISIQTEMVVVDDDDDDNDSDDDKDDNDDNDVDDDEIAKLERHIIEEEKYLEIMDKIDSMKKENERIFKWENAYLWNEYQVINWLNDIGFKQANYINNFFNYHISGDILLNNLTVDILIKELKIDRIDSLLIEKSIFILKNIGDKVLMSSQQKEIQNNDNLRFYKQKCEHLNRELIRMKKIEAMFKRNRRETESKLKQLQCNLYFGSLSQSHLMQKFDINQLFEIQTAYHKTLLNVNQCIQSKVVSTLK